MTDFTTLYIPVRIPTADVAALLAAQTGRDDDVVLAAEKAMRKRLAPDMRSGSDELELDEIKTAAQVDGIYTDPDPIDPETVRGITLHRSTFGTHLRIDFETDTAWVVDSPDAFATPAEAVAYLGAKIR